MSGPQKINHILADLMTRRGYAGQSSDLFLQEKWSELLGEYLAARSRPGKIYRGKLEIFVDNSSLLMEFNFQKEEILAKLVQNLEQATIREIVFKVKKRT